MCRFSGWLDKLLWEANELVGNPPAIEILRMKGLLSVAGSDKQHVLQAVGELYEVSPAGVWKDEAKRQSKIVVIGKGLRRQDLQAQLEECQQ